MGQTRGVDPMTHRTMSGHCTSHSNCLKQHNVFVTTAGDHLQAYNFQLVVCY